MITKEIVLSRSILSYRKSIEINSSNNPSINSSTFSIANFFVALEEKSTENSLRSPSLEHFSTRPDRAVSQKQRQYRPCICTPSILSPREMYFAYHSDATSLSDARSHCSRLAALARNRRRCSSTSIDVPEDCLLFRLRSGVYQLPTIVPSSPSSSYRS